MKRIAIRYLQNRMSPSTYHKIHWDYDYMGNIYVCGDNYDGASDADSNTQIMGWGKTLEEAKKDYFSKIED